MKTTCHITSQVPGCIPRLEWLNLPELIYAYQGYSEDRPFPVWQTVRDGVRCAKFYRSSITLDINYATFWDNCPKHYEFKILEIINLSQRDTQLRQIRSKHKGHTWNPIFPTFSPCFTSSQGKPWWSDLHFLQNSRF